MPEAFVDCLCRVAIGQARARLMLVQPQIGRARRPLARIPPLGECNGELVSGELYDVRIRSTQADMLSVLIFPDETGPFRVVAQVVISGVIISLTDYYLLCRWGLLQYSSATRISLRQMDLTNAMRLATSLYVYRLPTRSAVSFPCAIALR
jgi:hypothetical protein